jgi:hypothetical protein
MKKDSADVSNSKDTSFITFAMTHEHNMLAKNYAYPGMNTSRNVFPNSIISEIYWNSKMSNVPPMPL